MSLYRCVRLSGWVAWCFFVAGCVGIQSGKNELRTGMEEHRKGNLIGAFSIFSSLATSDSVTNQDARDFARRYLLENPEIGVAGLESINEVRLWEIATVIGDSSARQVMLNDLRAFEKVYGEGQYQGLVNSKVSWLSKRYHFLSSDSYSLLDDEKKKDLGSRYNLKLVNKRDIARVEGVDVYSDVRKGFDGGERVGYGLGSLLYLDGRSGLADYSAGSHFATIVVGGLIAANLLNRPDENYRVVKYGVRRLDGEFLYIDLVTYSGFAHTAGACIFLQNLMLINSDACDGIVR